MKREMRGRDIFEMRRVDRQARRAFVFGLKVGKYCR